MRKYYYRTEKYQGEINAALTKTARYKDGRFLRLAGEGRHVFDD